MRTLKIFLSVAALLVGAIGTVLTSGSPVQVSPQTISLIMALGGAAAILGISPFALGVAACHTLQAVAVVLSALVGWHSAVVTSAANAHPWAWAMVGLVAAVAGVLGKSPLPTNPPAPAAEPAMPPKPAV